MKYVNSSSFQLPCFKDGPLYVQGGIWHGDGMAVSIYKETGCQGSVLGRHRHARNGGEAGGSRETSADSGLEEEDVHDVDFNGAAAGDAANGAVDADEAKASGAPRSIFGCSDVKPQHCADVRGRPLGASEQEATGGS